jgi:hypothetical protein
MNLEIEMQGINIAVKLPARHPRDPFMMVAHDLMTETPPSDWDTIMDGERAITVPLKLANWRHVLRRLQRTWDYWRQPKNHAHILNSQESADQATAGFNLDPLVFTVHGVTYADLDDLPEPPDVICGLGTFILATPTLLVTDPCYEKGTWCTGELEARTGEWAAQVTMRDSISGQRNAILLVAHTSVDIRSIVLEELEDSGINAGVDSGQAGFFEKARYPDDKDQFEYEDHTWYGQVCEKTLDDEGGNASISPGRFGAVSQTFWGDGGYPVLVRKDADGLVIAAALIFDGSLGCDEDDEEDEEEESSKKPASKLAPVYLDTLIPTDYSELEVMPTGVPPADSDDANDIVIIRRPVEVARVPESELQGELKKDQDAQAPGKASDGLEPLDI